MSTEHNHILDPETLEFTALDTEAYHMVVGPALKAAAEAAAKRGDPTLHADMPAMLALVDIITHFADLYDQTYPDSATDAKQLESAPAGACVMVLQEAEMDPEAIGQCLAALEAAYQQLHEQEVIEAARPFIAHGWEHLVDGEREQGLSCLTMATHTIIAAIENWEAKVH